ncbi:MAG: glutamate--tRNA ligase family protein [Opitutales bacterium]|jgi:glutamyl-tRNA synthetase|nr:glutamate--tRNA ligase family protein [Opitutales bacterium]MDB2499393.1 glutamate--tRNA ligase family protein [bacterium]MDG2167233.1 glutamate--tRNA ligase family protein [Opitutales bacterium]
MSEQPYRGRIAPSPTGYLHLGHAKTFWTAFQRCQNSNGFLTYRDEDIDFHRCKDIFSQAAIDDLKQLGLNWDEGPVKQSQRSAIYIEVLEKLVSLGLAYPCESSRKDIKEHPDTILSAEGESIFPKALRPDPSSPTFPLNLKTNWRFVVPDHRSVSFSDGRQGIKSYNCQADFGDFLLWRKEGMPSYELAVVVDDIDMRITEVVRGADLLVSTARQLLMYEALKASPPAFYHEDLVTDESGERLAKRKDSLALRTLFAEGHSSDSIRRMWTAHP